MISLSPLPTSHPETFQRLSVRSSSTCYGTFNLSMGRSQGFASTPSDCTPYSDSLSLRLRTSMPLTLLVKVTRRLIMQKARRHPCNRTPTACKRTVSGSISLPCSGFFSPFLHSTGSLSVSQEYLALADGAACFPQDFSGPAVLRILLGNKLISLKGLSPSMVELSRSFGYQFIVHITVLQPQDCRNNLGCSPCTREFPLLARREPSRPTPDPRSTPVRA